MPRNQDLLPLPIAKGWQPLTDGDVEAISFLVTQGTIEIRVGDDNQPARADRGWSYTAGQGQLQVALTELAYAGGTRVWARPMGGDAMAMVDHA